MLVEQIAVFLENKSGRLAEITRILADNSINIRALSVADTADFGILRLIVDRVEDAEKALKENGFTVGKTHVVAVEVQDRSGGLSEVLKWKMRSESFRKASIPFFPVKRFADCK
ncbi:MAG: hypothetical protein CR992_00600 [Desulfobacterales bacterium]|nr:MAG: hypothetical protein CR992_00600 [Desulfobacterales bacterium]